MSRNTKTTRRNTKVMLSRVAASLYWMGRQLERAENLARMIDVNLHLSLDLGSSDGTVVHEHWLPLLRATECEELFLSYFTTATSDNVTEFMTFAPYNKSSIFSCIAFARENARQVRDQISLEMWEILNEAWLFITTDRARSLWQDGAEGFFEQIKRFSLLFQGVTNATFPRTEGFNYLQFGKFLERADNATRIVDLKYHILLPEVSDVGGVLDTAQWQMVLRSASALEAYRRHYVFELRPWKVAEFLLFSRTFPRSLRYCLRRVNYFYTRIAASSKTDRQAAGNARLTGLVDEMSSLDINGVFRYGLHEYLDRVNGEINTIGVEVYSQFMELHDLDLEKEILFHTQHSA